MIVVGAALLLGLRHAADPDHVAAVSTLVASERDGAVRGARRLGLAWGTGHATALLALGIPIVLYGAYLPAGLQRACEIGVGLVIVALAARLLVRPRAPRLRSPLQAYAVGVLHGAAGSAAVGLLLVAGAPGRGEALLALTVFAVASAFSMTMLSWLLGWTLTRRRLAPLAPALALPALLFGAWYAFAAAG